MAIEKRTRDRKTERAKEKEREGIDKKEEGRDRERGPRRPKGGHEGVVDQTRGGKITPRIIAFPSPRKEDRVIYNDTPGPV